MILTDPAIQSAVKSGDVFVQPFDKANLNPNSYNYHLADSLLLLGLGGKLIRKVSLSPRGYVLKPRKVYLGATLGQGVWLDDGEKKPLAFRGWNYFSAHSQ